MKKVKLKKLSNCDLPIFKDIVPSGTVIIGEINELPTPGYCFWVDKFHTSAVQEIIDENTFSTMNSVYQFEILI